MSMRVHMELPPLKSGGAVPVWVGNGFSIGGELVQVLEYGSNVCGWTDELTAFHEESAGSSHFIDNASRQYALRQLKNNLTAQSPVILEVGCSSGFMLRMIRERLPNVTLLGSDVISGALRQLAAKMPDIPLLQFDLVNCPLPEKSLDAVVMLNVLEHIEDDKKALQQVYRILKPGGIAVLEVPSGPHLYDIYDKMLMHRRRYSLTTLSRLVKGSGFEIIKKSHLGFFMYPGFSIVKKRNKRLLSTEKSVIRHVVQKNIRDTGGNRLLNVLMKIELLMGKCISYPFGIRCLLTCVKT